MRYLACPDKFRPGKERKERFPMFRYKLGAVAALACVLLGGLPAPADISVIDSSMDFLTDPDPAFDNDLGAVRFTETGGVPYLRQNESDAYRWHFQGQREYSSAWTGGTNSTWFMKTGEETHMEVSNTIVNNSSTAFTGYTIKLSVATLVDGSFNIDGVGYTMDMDLTVDYWGNYITVISLTFDELILAGESFDISYVLDLSSVIPPPPGDGEFGDEGSPTVPEPAAMVLLGLGSVAMLLRRRRRI